MIQRKKKTFDILICPLSFNIKELYFVEALGLHGKWIDTQLRFFDSEKPEEWYQLPSPSIREVFDTNRVSLHATWSQTELTNSRCKHYHCIGVYWYCLDIFIETHSLQRKCSELGIKYSIIWLNFTLPKVFKDYNIFNEHSIFWIKESEYHLQLSVTNKII